MDPIPGLKALQARKRDLLLESEVNRQLFRLELTKLQLSVDRLRRGFTSGSNLWKLLVPLTGFFMGRRFSRNSRLMTKGSVIVSLLGAAWKVWNAFKRTQPAEVPER